MLLSGLGGVLRPPRSAASKRALASLSLYSSSDLERVMVDRDPGFEEYRALCYEIGSGMIAWQRVESEHFRLFVKMLGAPSADICSAVYFSIESFEARHRVVERMVIFFLRGRRYKKQRVEWSGDDKTLGLAKVIKDANDNRNKLAHYGLDFELLGVTENPDGSVSRDHRPRLQPLRENVVSSMTGRAAHIPGHNLTAIMVKGYVADFRALQTRVEAFVDSLTLPPPQPEWLSLKDLGQTLPQTDEPSLSLGILEPKGTEPSGRALPRQPK